MTIPHYVSYLIQSFRLLLSLMIVFFVLIDAPVLVAKPWSSKPGFVSTRTHKRLQRVADQIEKGEISEAISDLTDFCDRIKKRHLDRAHCLQSLGYLYARKKEYSYATHYFIEALALKSLPKALTLKTLKMIARIFLISDRSEEAYGYLEKWFSYEKNPLAADYHLLAQVHLGRKDWPKALAALKSVVLLEKPLQRSTLVLLVGLHGRLKQYTQMVPYLHELISREPHRRDYWLQLTASYDGSKHRSKALAVIELAHKQNLLKSKNELASLIDRLNYQGAPYKAAQALQLAISAGDMLESYENLNRLAEIWLIAKEVRKALIVLNRARQMKHSPNDINYRLGTIYSRLENWKLAEESFARSINLDISDIHEKSRFGQAVSTYYLKQFDEAYRLFDSLDDRSTASPWLEKIKSEHGDLLKGKT